LETFIGIVLGAVISILVTIWVENLRRPRLRISIAPPVDTTLTSLTGAYQPMPFRSLRVRVSNGALSWLAGWLERAPALQCRGTITFHRYVDGQDVFGAVMAGRWAGGPQPSPIPIINATNNQIEHWLYDDERLGSAGADMDIYPGNSEDLDVVVRFNTDQDCYGWNNETYFLRPPAQPGRNPKWTLGHSRFLVKVVIRSSGHTRTDVFELINDVPVTSFRLEQVTSSVRARVQ
jgi:hypothetical protein